MIQPIQRSQFTTWHPARKVYQETDKRGSIWLVVRCPKCGKLRKVASDLQKDKTIWDVMTWLQRKEWICVVCEKWRDYFQTRSYSTNPPPEIV